jgi:hypothetical protein
VISYGGVFAVLVLWTLGLFALYWVVRLAVRHALTDIGVRRLVLKSYEDDSQASADPE